MNKIMLIGNLGRDPELNYTPSGTAIAKFSLAVSRTTKSPSGESQKETEWFNIIAWRQLAETCSNYLRKGQKVYIEGRLSQRKYTDKNGNERLSVEVTMNDMEMLTPKGQTDGGGNTSSSDAFTNDDSLGDLDEHPF